VLVLLEACASHLCARASVAASGGRLELHRWQVEADHRLLALRRSEALRGASSVATWDLTEVLTEQLSQLMDDGIVARHPKGAVPAPVEYELTEYGRSLLQIVDALRVWGRGHLDRGVVDD
jgi:hypothetical protein